MTEGEKVAASILFGVLLIVAYGEYWHWREQREWEGVRSAFGPVDVPAAPAVQPMPAPPVASERRSSMLPLGEGEQCIGGYVVFVQETTDQKYFTQRLVNGRPVLCAGKYKASP